MPSAESEQAVREWQAGGKSTAKTRMSGFSTPSAFKSTRGSGSSGQREAASAGNGLRRTQGLANGISRVGDTMGRFASDIRGQYNSMYVPLQKRIIDQAEVNPQQFVDEASVDSGASFDKAHGTMVRNMSRMGVNANSGRFMGMEQQWAIARAAAEAGAKTRARRNGQSFNLNRMLAAAAMGGGMPGLAMSGYGAKAGAYGSAAGINRAVASDYGDMAAQKGELAGYDQSFQSELDNLFT